MMEEHNGGDGGGEGEGGSGECDERRNEADCVVMEVDDDMRIVLPAGEFHGDDCGLSLLAGVYGTDRCVCDDDDDEDDGDGGDGEDDYGLNVEAKTADDVRDNDERNDCDYDEL